MQVFVHRLFAYRPHKPRNPLLRLLAGLVGVALLALLVVFGLFIGLGMLVFAAARRMFFRKPAAGRPAPEQVIEGEYSVIDKSSRLLQPR